MFYSGGSCDGPRRRMVGCHVWRPEGSLDTPQAERPGLRAAVTAGEEEPTGE